MTIVEKTPQGCVLFPQAYKSGLWVVTDTVKDFDYLLQILPAGRAVMHV